MHVLHSPASDLGKMLKRRAVPSEFLHPIEHNQLTNHCCRNLVEHKATIEAWKSSKDEDAPDIYIITCGGCGRKHRRFCIGESARPAWEVR